jgi:hypothetical protein
MTDVSLETLNRRTAVSAVHAEADRIGVNAELLLDSQSFYQQVTSLDPDSPDFRAQVRHMVAAAQGASTQATTASTARLAQTAQPEGEPRQWTMDDVEKSTPAETAAAMKAGLLTSLGCGPRRRNRR